MSIIQRVDSGDGTAKLPRRRYWALFLVFCASFAFWKLLGTMSEPAFAQELPVVGSKEFSATAKKVILKFDGERLIPQRLEVPKADASVFFVNRSGSMPVQLKIDFSKKKLHCHSKNLKLSDDGFLHTLQPLKPFDFEVLCFPVLGSYPYTIEEVGGAGRRFAGEVVIR